MNTRLHADSLLRKPAEIYFYHQGWTINSGRMSEKRVGCCFSRKKKNVL